MRTVKTLAAALVATVALNASAQEITDNYNRVNIGYQLNFLSTNDDDLKEEGLPNLNGMSVGYVHGFHITSMPMFIETGLKLSAGFGSKSYKDEYGKETNKLQLMSLTVPLNYVYKFQVADGIVLAPYAGFDFKVHLVGKNKYEWKDYRSGDTESESLDIFSKDDMGGDTFERFQMGWHIGVGAEWNSFYGGLEFGTDFLKLMDNDGYHINSGTFAVNIGYNF